jgi:hypothetical protein
MIDGVDLRLVERDFENVAAPCDLDMRHDGDPGWRFLGRQCSPATDQERRLLRRAGE